MVGDDEKLSGRTKGSIWIGQELWIHVPVGADEWKIGNFPVQLPCDASLRGFGTGSMPHVWDRLQYLNLPVTIVVGSHDERYREIARKLHERMSWAKVVVVAGVSHAVPLEAAGALARTLSQ